MKKTVLYLLMGFGSLVAVSIILGYVWFSHQLKPVDQEDQNPVPFVVPKGQATSVIAERLKEIGVIRHPIAFQYVVRQQKLATRLQAGSFTLTKSMTTAQVAQELTKGTTDIWVTIPEGKRVEEIAELFQGLSEFDQQEFITLSKDDEGYLFPDTYLFPKQATAQLVYSTMKKRFIQVATENQIESKAQLLELSLQEAVTLASLLEREARTAKEMGLVSGILHNRLREGMLLQVDATMQYAKTTQKTNGTWWTPPTAQDKELDSLYNTYKYVGLPPGPISNPGLKALIAAVSPTDSENFFYISDRDGVNMYYAETYQEHLENIERYLK